MKTMQIGVMVALLWLVAVPARSQTVSCPAGEMAIKGTVTNAPPPAIPPADPIAYLDCRFYNAQGVVVEDGFVTFYEFVAEQYDSGCLPLNSPSGVPATATMFDCLFAFLDPSLPTVPPSPKQAVITGVKTVNLVAPIIATTTTSTTETSTTATMTVTSSTSSTTSTTAAPTCTGGCEDGDPCTDDACVSGLCPHPLKTGLVGVQCHCEQSSPAACDGVTLPTAVAKRSAAVCVAVRKITAGAAGKKLRRLVGAVTRASNKTNNAVQKAVTKSSLFAACGDALKARLTEVRTGAGGLLTP